MRLRLSEPTPFFSSYLLQGVARKILKAGHCKGYLSCKDTRFMSNFAG